MADRYYDGFVDFPKGINSGAAPISIPPDQLAYMINGTVRDGFVSPRPPFVNRSIVFDSQQNQDLFEAGLWQGAAYYKPDSTNPNPNEGFVIQTGGNLFFIQIHGGEFTGTNITIPGDPNSSTLPFGWIWQAEKWAFVNNGASNCIIFDGMTSRRLDPVQEALGTTDTDFVVPAIGATVTISLAGNFTGQINQHVLLSSNGAGYIVTEIGGSGPSNNATLTPTYIDGTASYPQGTPLIQNPQVVARLAADFILPVQPNNPNHFYIVTVDTNLGWTGNHTVVMTDNNGIDRTFVFQKSVNGQPVASPFQYAVFPGAVSQAQSFVAGTLVKVVSAGTPVTIGTLGAAFTVPAIGVPGSTTVLPQYNGPDILVFAGNSQFTLHTVPGVPSATAITIRNLNDTPGDTQPAGTVLYSVPELPPGRMGAYGQGRIWEALTDGRSFIASDLVGSSSGTAADNFRDAVFHTTENMLLAGGGTFFVPGNIGNIAALSFSAILDQSLGQGPLNVFCPISVFSCNAPVDRTKWQDLVSPILPEVLIGSGAASQWSVINTNADIIFRAPDGTIRSLLLARLDYNKWGNTPISYEMLRVILSEDVSLMSYCSGVNFDNRALITCQPTANDNGVTFSGMMALNFDTISTLGQKSNSVWEGLWTGLNSFWIGTGRFVGVERAFAFYNNNGRIQLKEILPFSSDVLEDSTGPIQLQIETPVLFKNVKGKGYFDYAQLVDGELYFSDLEEDVTVNVEYRPDFYQNWNQWRQFTLTVNESEGTPQYRSRVGLGTPNANTFVPFTKIPTRLGRWFQLRITITGGRPSLVGCKLSALPAPQPDFAPVQPC